MPAVAQHALPVGIADHAIGTRRILFQPGEQGRPEVEADARIVVHDADDLVLAIDNARGAIGRIAFRRDAFIPIVVGCRRILGLHRFEPGIFPRRLIKMTVDADVALRGAELFGHENMIAAAETTSGQRSRAVPKRGFLPKTHFQEKPAEPQIPDFAFPDSGGTWRRSCFVSGHDFSRATLRPK